MACFLSLHPEASEEGEEGQEETPGGSGVRIQEAGAGWADPEAAVALGQHALTQRSVAPTQHRTAGGPKCQNPQAIK